MKHFLTCCILINKLLFVKQSESSISRKSPQRRDTLSYVIQANEFIFLNFFKPVEVFIILLMCLKDKLTAIWIDLIQHVLINTKLMLFLP